MSCALLGCSNPAPYPLQGPDVQAQATPPHPGQAPAPTADSSYHIDPQASSLHILVYRGGTMARLGHNHVISSADLRGQLWRGPTVESSGFEITVPVNTLIVDDDTARADEGEDFPLNVREAARAGTKANMLRPTLLDGDAYPDISIQSTRITGGATHPEVVATMRIKDRTREIRVPVTLVESDGTLTVQGSFDIRQSDFGITPLSIAMGALTVQDTVTIKFKLVARVSTPSS